MPAASVPPEWSTHRRFPVEYHAMDVLGHLNHAAYFRFMETLRCDLYLRASGLPGPRDLDIIIAEATCRYLAPVGYGVQLLGEAAPARPLGRTSFLLAYRFRDDRTGQETARGTTAVVCYDYARASKKLIPPETRRNLEAMAIDLPSEGWPRPAASHAASTGKQGVGEPEGQR